MRFRKILGRDYDTSKPTLKDCLRHIHLTREVDTIGKRSKPYLVKARTYFTLTSQTPPYYPFFVVINSVVMYIKQFSSKFLSIMRYLPNYV